MSMTLRHKPYIRAREFKYIFTHNHCANVDVIILFLHTPTMDAQYIDITLLLGTSHNIDKEKWKISINTQTQNAKFLYDLK